MVIWFSLGVYWSVGYTCDDWTIPLNASRSTLLHIIFIMIILSKLSGSIMLEAAKFVILTMSKLVS